MPQITVPVLRLPVIRESAETCTCPEPRYTLARVLLPDGTVRIDRWCIDCGKSLDPLYTQQ